MLQKFKTVGTLFFFLMVNSILIQGQEVKSDKRIQLIKEDAHNLYQSTSITQLDLLQALDFAGIQVKKFNLGKFDKRYRLHIFAETYEEGKVVDIDTLVAGDNRYHHYQVGTEDYFFDYLDQFKFLTKDDDNKSEIRLHTYKMSMTTKIELKKWDDKQFYNWRSFDESHWKLNKKVPLMVFASSWKDKKFNFQRFCGVVKLTEGHEDTLELLEESPTYVLFSYQVSPMPEKSSETGDR